MSIELRSQETAFSYKETAPPFLVCAESHSRAVGKLETAMPKKKPSSWSSSPPGQVSGPHSAMSDPHTAPENDLYFLAQSCQKAAKRLAEPLQLGSNPLGEFDVYPVLHIYRHAMELFLKAMVLGDGGNFLATKPDHISISKTHSLSWLAQFVVQIVTALGWEERFRCEGVEDLAGFKAIIEEVNRIDVGHGMFRVWGDLVTRLPELLRRVDALSSLLNSTADALAAEWDLRNEDVEGGWRDGTDFEPTIQ